MKPIFLNITFLYNQDYNPGQALVLFGSLGSRASGPVGVCRWLGTSERGNSGIVHSLTDFGRNLSLHCNPESLKTD